MYSLKQRVELQTVCCLGDYFKWRFPLRVTRQETQISCFSEGRKGAIQKKRMNQFSKKM